MASKPIKIDLVGDDSGLKRTLKGASKSLTGFGKSVAKIGVTSAAAFGATAVAIGTKSVTAYAGFQKGMAEVMTLLPEAGEETFGKLSSQLKDFSKEFGVMTDEAIPGLYSALSAGVDEKNVFTFMETAQRAAAAGVTSLEVSIDGISSVINSYGAEVISATEASDLMFTAVKLGKTTFEEISGSIFQMAPIASAVGIPFKDLTASIANLTAAGTPTSVAAGQMKSAMAELGKAGTKADVAFRDLTGMGLQQFLEEEGNFAAAMITMKEGADEAGISVLDMFGSVEAGQGILALTADGGDKYIETLQAMNASSGATAAAYEVMDDTLGASFNKIKANLQVLAIEIGEKLAPLVEKATTFMVDNFDQIKPTLMEAKKAVVDFSRRASAVLKDVIRWVKENERWLTMVAASIGAVVLAVKTYTTVVKIQKAMTLAWTKATKIATGAQAAFNAVMALNPIGIVVAAIVGLIAILTAAYFKFESVRNIVDEVFDVFQWTAKALRDVVWPIIEQAIDHIIDIFQLMWEKIELASEMVMALFTGDFSGAFDILKDLASSALGLIVDLFIDLPVDIFKAVAPLAGKFALIVASFSVDLVGKILKLVQGMPDKIVELLGKVVPKIVSLGLSIGGWIISGIGDALAAIGTKILYWVHTGINNIFQSIVSLGSDIGGWIINGLISAITGAAGAIWDALKDAIPGLGDLGGFFGKLFSSGGGGGGGRVLTNAPWERNWDPTPSITGPMNARGVAEEISRRIATGVLDPATLTRNAAGVITSGTPQDLLIASGVIREFTADLAGVSRRFDDPFWGESVVPFGPGSGLTNWQALGPDLSGRPMGMNGTNIDITVNAGLGTDGRTVGDQIVSELTQWTRTNGGLPLTVTAV